MALINIAGKSYELILENKAGWNVEAFRNRYSEVLERYDFVVGDWGYNQLRLKGFFKEGNSKATKDSAYSYVLDYINEYCNFGCAYFVLEKKSDNSEANSNGDLEPPLIEDLDLQYEGESQVGIQKNIDNQEDSLTKENAQVEIKSANRSSQEKQAPSKEQKDKPFKRRSFKHRQNKNNNNNVTSTEETPKTTGKDPNKKNKRRPNRPFKHFDRKKNKEQVTTTQE